ncbi:unnamed protein product, partial [Gadus morhua 'NCC']
GRKLYAGLKAVSEEPAGEAERALSLFQLNRRKAERASDRGRQQIDLQERSGSFRPGQTPADPDHHTQSTERETSRVKRTRTEERDA